MNNDISTAYICIYCPFNSDNLEALEAHLTRAHGHGCQDGPSSESPSSPSSLSTHMISHKSTKRKLASDDEQSSTFPDDEKSSTVHVRRVKRVKCSSSSPKTSSILYINGNDHHSDQGDAGNDAHNGNGNDDHDSEDDDDEEDDDDDDDDERDSPTNAHTSTPRLLLTCPTCGSTYHRIGHLIRHAKRKHQIDLSNDDPKCASDLATKDIRPVKYEDVNEEAPTEQSLDPTSEPHPASMGQVLTSTNPVTTSSTTEGSAAPTECPYCEFKTIDMEEFKIHIAAHIRDKNYRCLLCNRLYKYRGDCSFHIRRKHHRYSANANDYIQRFLFDTSDDKESTSAQAGGNGSSINGSTNSTNLSRDQEEPVRYFGCPYCDYTSNYGGDVRKHQARKHPNLESKVLKIIRQDAEQQIPLSHPSLNIVPESGPTDHTNGKSDDQDMIININILDQSGVVQKPRKEKIKTVKKLDISHLQPNPAALAMPPGFAPVRVFQCSACQQQGTYKWVVERHIRAKHPDQLDAHVIELPAELGVKLQKLTPPLKRYRCSLCPLQSKHTWVIIRHIKHFHTLQTASVLDIQPDGTMANDEESTVANEDLSTKSYHQDPETSLNESSCAEATMEEHHNTIHRMNVDDDDNADDDEHDADESDSAAGLNTNGVGLCLYKCSLCDFTSNMSWTTQNHINEFHPGQTNVCMLTHYRMAVNDSSSKSTIKKPQQKNHSPTSVATVTKVPLMAPLSPASAVAKAKFSPEVEKALLDLQNSKLNHTGPYAAQPKFGIKRLKCRYCFYRSNWKTDMIRHVRIRHNITDPDHNRDMITMTEDEARATIEAYENTFGKELRRRTFRTWNDWGRAEQEFTPRDGSLDYNNSPVEGTRNEKQTKSRTHSTTNGHLKSMPMNDSIKQTPLIPPMSDSKLFTTNYEQSSSRVTDDYKQLPNPSNIVSRLLVSTAQTNSNDDDAPLDLSIKSSSKPEAIPSTASNENEQSDDEDESDGDNPHVQYCCSACPYKHSNIKALEHHRSIHLTGQGLSCPLCSYTSSARNSIIRHLSMAHFQTRTSVEFPPATRISNVQILERHQCPLCPYQCDQADGLNIHRRLEHQDDEFDLDSSTASTRSETDVKDASDEPINATYSCDFCTSQDHYSNLEQFTVHIFTEHANQLGNNQSCPFCSFIAHTTSIYTLPEHIKLHFNGTLVQPDAQMGYEHVKELFSG